MEPIRATEPKEPKEPKGFRMQSKRFFLTYPQCDASKESLLTLLESKGSISVYIIARELHQDGHAHLHAYVEYFDKKHVRSSSYFDLDGKHGDYQTARHKDKSIAYVAKHGDFIANFDPLLRAEAKLNKKRDISKDLIRGRPLVEVVEENPELLFGYRNLKRDVQLFHMDKIKPVDRQKDNLWIFGEPGIGKSYWVRNTFKDVYVKPQNKWWDGYVGQKIVLVDDVDSEQLGHLFKIWGDNYAFEAETKGGTIRPDYDRLIVTSNYLPNDLFKDKMMSMAISRRFKICTVEGQFPDFRLVDSYGLPMGITGQDIGDFIK